MSLGSIVPEWNYDLTVSFEKDANGCLYKVSSGLNTVQKRVEKYGQSDIVNEELLAMMWGSPFIGCYDAKMQLSNVEFTTGYDNVCKLAVWGDSFIEGSSLLPTGLQDRYVAKIAADLGADKVAIFGKGGERLREHWLDSFEIENDWFLTQYVLIAMGTNNRNYSEYLTNLQAAIAFVKSKGSIPILVTVTPRPDSEGSTEFKDFRIAANAYVRGQSELFVDIANVVTTDNTNDTWKEGYVFEDLTHPTAAGHLAIYNKFKELFSWI